MENSIGKKLKNWNRFFLRLTIVISIIVFFPVPIITTIEAIRDHYDDAFSYEYHPVIFVLWGILIG